MDLSKYFIKSPLIPAIIQEKGTGQVLMLAYMNEESLSKTIESGYTWFYSRSRNELWNKGATSGNVQKVVSITADCDEDTLLIEVEQTGPACHTGNHSCFYNLVQVWDRGNEEAATNAAEEESESRDQERALRSLYEVVSGRKETYSKDSYTCYLFEKGLDKILKKCGEECSEVIIAAKNKDKATSSEELLEAEDELKNEICDLLYHLTVLMVNEEITLDDVYEILHKRSQKIGNLKTFHKTDHNT
ncbi:MAG: bifunctional phosphoribosyl-AMP cyclohydrolase/phosphoribosyl-ATP diphosphatase HisIE [Anaerovoracaceae bacterium]|jgi:phosphoribosyl-ATP pyrophosphohydrolase/phosphoribosyl-AMP cyclohydrolase